MKSVFSIAAAVVLLASCAQVSHTDHIAYQAPDRVKFQGKGAGAGIALMSTMGPVGIALGVAIDEGIAKSIDENARQHNVDLVEEFRKRLAAEMGTALSVRAGQMQFPLIKVTHLGFKVVDASANDASSAELIIEYQKDASSTQTLNFPGKETTGLTTYPLEQIKQDAEAARVLVQNAATALSQQLIALHNKT